MSYHGEFQAQMARAYAEVGLMYSTQGAKEAADYVNREVKPMVDEYFDSQESVGCRTTIKTAPLRDCIRPSCRGH